MNISAEALKASLAQSPVARLWQKLNINIYINNIKNYNLEPLYRWLGSRLVRLIWRPQYQGFAQIPQTGPCLIIANHVSYIDGVILQAGINRPVRFVIDGEIYNLPGVHYWMAKVNRAIPILPNRESVTKALESVSDALRAGDAVCIFPEGQLTYTGSLGRFRPGIEWILKRDPVIVYPVGITGLWGSIFSRKYRKARLRWWPRKWNRRIRAVCGSPIPPEQVNVNMLQRTVLSLKHA